MTEEREMYQGDERDLQHKRSLRASEPRRPEDMPERMSPAELPRGGALPGDDL